MSQFPGSAKQLAQLQTRVRAERAAEKYRQTSTGSAKVSGCVEHQAESACVADPECEWTGGVLGFWKSCRTKDLKGQWRAYYDLFCDPAVVEKEGYRAEIAQILSDFGIEPSVFDGATAWTDVSKAQLCSFFTRMNSALDELDQLPTDEQAARLGIAKSVFDRGIAAAEAAALTGDKTLDMMARKVGNNFRAVKSLGAPLKMLAILLVISQAAAAQIALEPQAGALGGTASPYMGVLLDDPVLVGMPSLVEVFGKKENVLTDPATAQGLRREALDKISKQVSNRAAKFDRAKKASEAANRPGDRFMTDTDENPLDQWQHPEAAEYYLDFVSVGGEPIGYINAPGGIVIWEGDGSPFLRHELRDEYVAHRFPSAHHDYFTSFVEYEIPDDKVWDVLRLSGSVHYDPLKRELSARCATIEANIASLTLATKIAEGEISIDDIHREGIYSDYIESTIDEEALEAMLLELTDAVERNNVTDRDYWQLAFPYEE